MSARYGRAQVLSGVELDVQPESCVAVVGESGSGKTTLARCIVGLHSDWTGEITFDGRTGWPRRPRPAAGRPLRRVQYIFQNPYTSLNPRKTVGQIVAQPLEQLLRAAAAGSATERVARVLEDVSLGSDFVGPLPGPALRRGTAAGGIARALVVEPDLLVCDEVTSALDVSVQAVIVELLRRLQRERQLAMIFITHNLALVRSIAQSAVVLCDGRGGRGGPGRAGTRASGGPVHDPADRRRAQARPPGAQREAGGAAAAGAAAP